MHSTPEIATPLRRISAWGIDIALFVPLGAAIGFAVGLLWVLIEDLIGDIPYWFVHIIVMIIFVAATYAIFSLGLLGILRRASMNNRQIAIIFAPILALFILFVLISLLYPYLGQHIFVVISSPVAYIVAYIVWTLILFGNGQTVGKRLVGIQSVRQNGEPAGWGLTFVREITKALLHILLIGFVIDGVMLLSDKAERQSVADRIAGTVVVHINPQVIED